METVTISLNGRLVAGTPHTTILDLARQVGVEIPTLCHHPLLKNSGACRVCLVEETKTRSLLASCVTPIADGMQIQVNSAHAVSARRGVLELILSDHPSSCVICNKGNQCTLRSLAKEHGICDPDMEPVRRWRSMQELNPFIVRDLTKCVLCGRCIRACRDFEAVGAVDYVERGYLSHPGTSGRSSLDHSECNFCGTCVAVCPTDALAEKGRPSLSSGKDRAPGICYYCGTGCRLDYELVDRIVVGARGVADSPVNSISLCVRGHYGHDALSSAERLIDPLVRNGSDKHRKASWEEALGETARRLSQVIERFGPESVGILVGTQCSNEEVYLAARLARAVLGTPHIDSAAGFTSGAAVDALAASLYRVRPVSPFVERIPDAETIVMIGTRPDYTHPIVARNIRRAVRHNGAHLIQLDPVTTSLSPFARMRLRQRIDEFPVVLAQVMRELVADKRYDEDFVREHVLSGEQFLADLAGNPLDVPVKAEIKQLAKLIGAERKCMFIFGSRVARATQGYILTRLLVDLALLCGQPDNVLFLYKGCNEVGAWELGCAPDRLPGSLVPMDHEALEALKTAWGRKDLTLKRGLDAMGMMRATEKGELKAIMLLGVDPLAVFPDTKRTQKAISQLDLVVRTGMFKAIGAEQAHIALPTAAMTETDGTYVSIEGRVQRVSKITDAPGNARPTARLLLDLAGALGSPFGFVTAREIFQEITTTCPAWHGLNWEDVGKMGGTILGNPADSRGSTKSGTVRKLAPYPPPDSFVAPPQPPSERPWKVYPEAQLAHPGDGVLSTRSRRLARFGNGSSVRMNPADMQRIGAAQDSWLVLRSEVGEVKVQVTEDIEVPRSGLVVPVSGPRYVLQELLPWPEEYCPPGWDRIHVSIASGEEG